LLTYRKAERVPEITASRPGYGEKEAKVEKILSVSFDIPMNPDTIRRDTIQLYINGGLYPIEVSYNPDNRMAILTVNNSLPGGMPCEIRLKSLVQAVNGNPIKAARITFTTAP